MERFSYTAGMTKEFVPAHLNIPAFIDAGGACSGHVALSRYPRLMEDLQGSIAGLDVQWHAHGELRPVLGGHAERWLHLEVSALVPMTCQRCLAPVELPLQVDRWFRFVADEATAEAQDEGVDEDLLVTSRDFDLYALVEDELLMELPVVPRHDVCPEPVKMQAEDADFEAAEESRPNPFAALTTLQKKP